MSNIREGDIEDLRRKMRQEGRPIKSDVIRDKDGGTIFYKEKEGGRVEIKEVIN